MDVSVGIVVGGDQPEAAARANKLSHELGLPLVGLDEPGYELQLVVTDRRLELREVGQKTGPVYVDFASGTAARRGGAGLSRDPLVRAVGRKTDEWRLIDATAGLGRDAFLLARSGSDVTMIERSPVIAALLEDGLQRAMGDPHLAGVVASRLRLVRGDARQVLAELPEAERPDAVYIDPMFAARAKTALSKKEMRLCRLVSGDDPDAGELLEAARGAARHRVVVKRWLHAAPLGSRPSIQYKGQSIRYDVYLA